MMSAALRSDAPDRLAGAAVLVVGAAKSGLALVRFLVERGARVTLTDVRPAADLGEAVAGLAARGVRLEVGGHHEPSFLGADLIAVSPGVPLAIAPLQAARAKGVEIVAEVEIASWYLRGKIVGITGSNGKSTTTSLAGHILSRAGLDAVACGNLGTPLVALVDDDRPERIYVVELSSFQLEGIDTFRPSIAALLNLTPDHQDRYHDNHAYYAAKARLFMNQGSEDRAIVNHDDPEIRPFLAGIAARRLEFSRKRMVAEGAFIHSGEIVLRSRGRDRRVMRVDEIPLFGEHNQENVLAALLIADQCGVAAEAAAEGVRTFKGLPHRLERVRDLDGVAWFNDSKATNVGAAIPSLASFRGGVVLILGGKDKGGRFADLVPLIRSRATHLILIGKARESIKKQLGPVAPMTLVEGMAEAVETARRVAPPGGVVLLAPACASFDQYSGFEARGDHFRQLVLALPGGGAGGRGGAAGAPAEPEAPAKRAKRKARS